MKVFLSFFLLLVSSHLRATQLSHEGHTLFIDNNKNWEIGKELFGIPFILFSPQKNGQRSNMSFAHTGAEIELEVKALKDNQKAYQNNKEKWAKIHSANIKEFYPYKSFLNSHNHRVHSIGLSYEHEDKVYVETSYYTECKGKIVFSKGLRLSINEDHQSYFHSLVNSLDCGLL